MKVREMVSDRKREKHRIYGQSLQRSVLKLTTMLVLAIATATAIVFIPAAGSLKGERGLLNKALGEGMTGTSAGKEMALRVIDQRFQTPSETDDLLRNIPPVDVWVLNDPFYPLMGEVGTLRKKDGALSSKQWQIIGFPEYETEGGTTTTTPTTTPTSPTPVTSSLPQNVVLVKDIYEVRGIKYATIKVNDQTYDKLKPGSEFANVFRVMEIKDNSVVLQCGDEVIEIPENQIRKV